MNRSLFLIALLLSGVLTGCGGGGGSDAGDNTPATDDLTPATGIDISNAVFTERSADCADYSDNYQASVMDIQRSLAFVAAVSISADNNHCTVTSDAIPNHDFNDATAAFATAVTEVQRSFSIPRNPVFAADSTALALTNYDAIMLNGVVVDLLAADCYGIAGGNIGCNDINTEWRYDPMSPLVGFGTDAHNAHTQPDGTYHYHGDPLAMYDDAPGPNGSPVIGFAADGFPIYGPYFYDGSQVRKAVSGYTVKTGIRSGGPGGNHDGSFIDDYEFTGAGDLDECNGMTVDDEYGYYITDSYPWVLGCFKGTPDSSFDKN